MFPNVMIEVVECEDDHYRDGHVAFWFGEINGEETPGNGPEVTVWRLPGFADRDEDYIDFVSVNEPGAPETRIVVDAIFEYIGSQGDDPTWQAFVAWARAHFTNYDPAIMESWGYSYV